MVLAIVYGLIAGVGAILHGAENAIGVIPFAGPVLEGLLRIVTG